MTSSREHYDQHLGPVYSWMVGDPAAAMERNRQELCALGIGYGSRSASGSGSGSGSGSRSGSGFKSGSAGLAVDLGAGPGLHALPLARFGFRVVAIDDCEVLLTELRERAGRGTGALPIDCVAADLLSFPDHSDGPIDVLLCMGDTLTHLPCVAYVETLLERVAPSLAPGGIFVATLRDYTTRTLEGPQRFIPVRSDENRILTCFLEYGADKVMVHDVLHERQAQGWLTRVSSYPKLRLDPAWVAAQLAAGDWR